MSEDHDDYSEFVAHVSQNCSFICARDVRDTISFSNRLASDGLPLVSLSAPAAVAGAFSNAFALVVQRLINRRHISLEDAKFGIDVYDELMHVREVRKDLGRNSSPIGSLSVLAKSARFCSVMTFLRLSIDRSDRDEIFRSVLDLCDKLAERAAR